MVLGIPVLKLSRVAIISIMNRNYLGIGVSLSYLELCSELIFQMLWSVYTR